MEEKQVGGGKFESETKTRHGPRWQPIVHNIVVLRVRGIQFWSFFVYSSPM